MIDSTGRGVLNDWDLSHRAGEPHRGGERTGTTTFMALGLLCREYCDGRMERQYHHDLEGFIWILPWVFLQFEVRTGPTGSLQVGKPATLKHAGSRRVILSYLLYGIPPPTHGAANGRVSHLTYSLG